MLLALSLALAEPVPPPPPPAAIFVHFTADAVDVRVADGVADRATGRLLDADSPVRIASISKLVVALGVMRLVEQGVVDLDSDVSRWLGWRLRSPHFPDRPISLADLLGHRAGLTDRIDYILPLDGDLPAALADADGWDADRPPGGAFVYANINFPVVAAVMEGATGERFDRLMRRLVLDPLGIDGCYNWATCSDAAVARAVTLYRPDGTVARDDLGGRRPACPVVPARDGGCDLDRYVLARNGSSFSPQGGLRISAAGLARIGQMWLRGGEGFLSRASLDRLTAVQPVTATGSAGGEGGEGRFFCRYALAVQQLATPTPGCADDPVGDGRPRIGHSGEAYSLRSGLWIDRERGDGLAWFVTELPEFGAPQGRRSAFTAAEEALIDRGLSVAD